MAIGQYLGVGSGTTKGLYHLNGNANDDSGNGNNGTATNITWTGGIIGSGSASFNGTSSYIDIPNSTTFDIQNITIKAKVKFTTLPTTGGAFIFEKGPVNTQYSLFFEAGSGVLNLIFRTYNTVGTMHHISTPVTLSTNTIYTIGATYDGINKKLFLNGVEIGSVAYTQTLKTGQSGQKIGATGSLTTGYFMNGLIDEVIIENRAWPPEEIQKYYTFSKGRYGIL